MLYMYCKYLFDLIYISVHPLLFANPNALGIRKQASERKQAHYVKIAAPNFIFKRPTTESPFNILKAIEENLKWDHILFHFSILMIE